MNILCFGDSNTFGYDPRGFFGGRYDKPWPQLLAEYSGWSVQNQGENGREVPRCPIYFPKDIDHLIILLGTNDLLQGNSAEIVGKRMEGFLQSIDLETAKLLLIAPPMKLGAWITSQTVLEAAKELTFVYRSLSQRLGIRFVNAEDWNIDLSFDGVHFTEDGHRAFALALERYLRKGD